MASDRFDIYFSGCILPDHPAEQVREALGKLFRADQRQLDRLFSGSPVRIKRDVDVDTASRYRATLRSVGALVDIQPRNGRSETTPRAAPAEASPPPTTGLEVVEGVGLELLPPRTGSLEDCAPPPAESPAVRLEGITLAALGEDLDQSAPPSRAVIRTDHLTADPPNTGSLEDCVAPRSPTAIPEISHLELAED